MKSDGTYFEQSSDYHRYTTDIYSHFLILLRQNTKAGNAVESEVEQKLVLLLDHLIIQRPAGTTPFFGDDDGGRLMILDQHSANDFRLPSQLVLLSLDAAITST